MFQTLLFCSGPLVPFVLLVLIAMVSGVCARVIASEDAHSAPSGRAHADGGGPVVRAIKLPARACGQGAPHNRCAAYVQQPTQEIIKQFVDNKVLSDFAIPKPSNRARKSENKSRARFKPLEDKPMVANHYVCPPTSLEELRKRYGTGNFWGDWSNSQTRQFYKQQLPRSLQIDGALGLTLEERAQLAAQARHALRIYSRERCHLPGRLIARLYDGLRHLHMFGYWSSDGMSWNEVKEKYAREARKTLGEEVSEEIVALYVYRRILDRASASNALFDEVAISGDREQYVNIMNSIYSDKTAGGVGAAGAGRSGNTEYVSPLDYLEKLTTDFEYEKELLELRMRWKVKELEAEVSKVVSGMTAFLQTEEASRKQNECDDRQISDAFCLSQLAAADTNDYHRSTQDVHSGAEGLIAAALEGCLEGVDYDISDSIALDTHVCGEVPLSDEGHDHGDGDRGSDMYDSVYAGYEYCSLEDSLTNGAFATVSDTVSEGFASERMEPLMGSLMGPDPDTEDTRRRRKRDIVKGWFKSLRPRTSMRSPEPKTPRQS